MSDREGEPCVVCGASSVSHRPPSFRHWPASSGEVFVPSQSIDLCATHGDAARTSVTDLVGRCVGGRHFGRLGTPCREHRDRFEPW